MQKRMKGIWSNLWEKKKEDPVPYLIPDPRTRNLNEILYQRQAKPHWKESREGGVWIHGKQWM